MVQGRRLVITDALLAAAGGLEHGGGPLSTTDIADCSLLVRAAQRPPACMQCLVRRRAACLVALCHHSYVKSVVCAGGGCGARPLPSWQPRAGPPVAVVGPRRGGGARQPAQPAAERGGAPGGRVPGRGPLRSAVHAAGGAWRARWAQRAQRSLREGVAGRGALAAWRLQASMHLMRARSTLGLHPTTPHRPADSKCTWRGAARSGSPSWRRRCCACCPRCSACNSGLLSTTSTRPQTCWARCCRAKHQWTPPQ